MITDMYFQELDEIIQKKILWSHNFIVYLWKLLKISLYSWKFTYKNGFNLIFKINVPVILIIFIHRNSPPVKCEETKWKGTEEVKSSKAGEIFQAGQIQEQGPFRRRMYKYRSL